MEPKYHVLISGCDTGVGHMLADQLFKKGYTVFAGCLNDEGVQKLHEKGITSSASAGGKLYPFHLDVTFEGELYTGHPGRRPGSFGGVSYRS